jgi:hypothetical protein
MRFGQRDPDRFKIGKALETAWRRSHACIVSRRRETLDMNEITRERSTGFKPLQDALSGVAKDIAHYVKDPVT